MTGAAWGFLVCVWAIIFVTIGASMSKILKNQ